MLHQRSHSRRHHPWVYYIVFLLVPLLCVVLAGQTIWAGSTKSPPEETVENMAGAAGDELVSPVAARLSAGLLHSAMINYDGQLYVWGDNTYGQLGLGTLDYGDTPQLVNLPDKVSEISLGAYHSLAVLADGTVYAFGRNAFGQLGIGSTENAIEPVMLEGLPPIKAVAAGTWHSLALGIDGSVWAWGNNSNFQVGDVPSETITDAAGTVLGSRCTTPVQIVSKGAAAIAAGGQFSMYLDEAGQVYTWGDNSRGQLGNGTTQQSAKPAMVPGLENVAAISAGYQHCLAISRQADQDALMVWGDDSLGQLGIGSDPAAGIFRSLPERLDTTGDKNPENDRIVMIQAGYSQSVAVSYLQSSGGSINKNRQQLLVWGNNSSGQLALGNTISQNRPAVLSGTFNSWTGDSFLPFDAIASGGYHLLVLSSKGLLGAAGRGDRGQLGNLSVLDRSQLTPVAVPDVIRPVWLSGAKLSARFDADENLVVRWPKAQDNRLATGYKVILERSDGQIQEFGVGNKLSLSINNVSSRFAYEIKVLAYDADSVHADTATLSFLADYILPAEAASQGAVPADYFSDIIQSVWQINNLAHHWVPDPRGVLQPLEMPWDVSSIYGEDRLPLPANWQAFIYAALGAGILSLLTVLDILRKKALRQRKKRQLPVNARGQKQTG